MGYFASGWRKIAGTERWWRVVYNDRKYFHGWGYEWIEGVYIWIILVFVVIIFVIIVIFVVFVVVVVNDRWG